MIFNRRFVFFIYKKTDSYFEKCHTNNLILFDSGIKILFMQQIENYQLNELSNE